MGKFLHHAPCPSCGSRDNLGVWDNGVFCFGCKYRKKERGYFKPDDGASNESSSNGRLHQLHAGSVGSPPAAVFDWLEPTGISWEECYLNGARWNDSWQQLVFFFRDEGGKLVCAQARNFDPDRATKAKYYNVGEKEEVFQIVGQRGKLVIFTEDYLSSIKVGRHADAMPLLGVSISAKKLTKILRQGYQSIIVWLDRDKWREAMEIADKAKWLGISARCVYTDEDPKYLSDDEIKEIVK